MVFCIIDFITLSIVYVIFLALYSHTTALYPLVCCFLQAGARSLVAAETLRETLQLIDRVSCGEDGPRNEMLSHRASIALKLHKATMSPANSNGNNNGNSNGNNAANDDAAVQAAQRRVTSVTRLANLWLSRRDALQPALSFPLQPVTGAAAVDPAGGALPPREALPLGADGFPDESYFGALDALFGALTRYRVEFGRLRAAHKAALAPAATAAQRAADLGGHVAFGMRCKELRRAASPLVRFVRAHEQVLKDALPEEVGMELDTHIMGIRAECF